jgi:elongation factor G
MLELPQVAYRETLENASEVEYTHKKQSGGAGQFAKVKLLVEPQEPGAGRSVESKIKGGAIPKEFIPGVEKGIETVSDGGILAGFPNDRLQSNNIRWTTSRRRL